jgi:hypothetical protein
VELNWRDGGFAIFLTVDRHAVLPVDVHGLALWATLPA